MHRFPSTSKPVLFAFVGLLSLWPPSAGLAQTNLEGMPIREIEFVGLHALPESTLLFYLDIEEGEPFSTQGINDSFHALWEHGLVDDIIMQAEPAGDGVKVTFTVRERPLVAELEYDGLKRVTNSDILDLIARKRIRLQEGDTLDLGELYRLGAAIEDLYAEKGFRLAEVRYNVENISPSERRVVFTIDEGDKVRIGGVTFDGNTVLSDRGLRRAMEKTKRSNLVTRLRKRDIYREATLAEDLKEVGDAYRERGYKDAVVGEPEVEIRGQGGDDSKRRLFLTVPVQEGARWSLGEIKVEGNDTFETEFLLGLVPEPRGGWLRSKIIDEGKTSMEEVYSNTGFLFSTISPEIREADEQEYVADVVYHIDEGDQYRIRSLEFEGNVSTRDKVLRREMAVQEGYVMNAGALRNSLLRMRQLEFFKIDEENPVEIDTDTEEKVVDLVVQGSEGDRTELQFGAGYSEFEGFFGQFLFTTRNFLGRGETLTANLQNGRFGDRYEFSYGIPWFLDRPQNLGINLFVRDIDNDFIPGQRQIQETEGGSFSYSRNLTLFSSAGLTYTRLSSFNDLQVGNPTGGDPFRLVSDRELSSLRLNYVWSRIDSRLNPTRGPRFQAIFDYAGGALGGDDSYLRPILRGTIYQPITQKALTTVLALNVEASTIDPFDGTELFRSDRFYTGGETSIRGFSSRSLFPRDGNDRPIRDPDIRFVLGGDKRVFANLEYHLVPNESFRVLAFVDAGNVFFDDQDWDFGDLRYSAGLEFRVTVPLFGAPLRFIWANNLDPIETLRDENGEIVFDENGLILVPGDNFDDFQFAISTTF